MRCHHRYRLLTQQQNHLLTWVSSEKDHLILFHTHINTVPSNHVTGCVGRCRIVTFTSCIASALPVLQRKLILSLSVGTWFLPYGLVFTLAECLETSFCASSRDCSNRCVSVLTSCENFGLGQILLHLDGILENIFPSACQPATQTCHADGI